MRTVPLAIILGAVACLVAFVASRRRGRWRGVSATGTPRVPSSIDRAAFEPRIAAGGDDADGGAGVEAEGGGAEAAGVGAGVGEAGGAEAGGAGAEGPTWLVATFTDRACRSCASTLDRLAPLAGPDVEVREFDAAGGDRALHDRYEVDAVPLTLLADASGAVRAWILGPPTESDLATLREVTATAP